jgi:hypothetical protein
MKESYFILNSTEDGVYITEYKTAEKLSEYLAGNRIEKFFSSLPKDSPSYWDAEKVLIIKGEIIVPKPKTTITEWEI